MIEIQEYIDASEKMKKLGLRKPEFMAILPRNFDTAETPDLLLYPNEAKTIHSLIRQAEIDITPLEDGILFKDEQSFTFVAPLILFTSIIIAQNPHLINITINIISDYIYDRIRGTRKNANLKLEYIIETRNGDYKKLNYEGNIDGLNNLPEIIKEIHDD